MWPGCRSWRRIVLVASQEDTQCPEFPLGNVQADRHLFGIRIGDSRSWESHSGGTFALCLARRSCMEICSGSPKFAVADISKCCALCSRTASVCRTGWNTTSYSTHHPGRGERSPDATPQHLRIRVCSHELKESPSLRAISEIKGVVKHRFERTVKSCVVK